MKLTDQSPTTQENSSDVKEKELEKRIPIELEKPLIKRATAFVIDSSIIYFIATIIEHIFPLGTSEEIFNLIPLGVCLIYFLLFERGGKSNASLGKRWMKLKVSTFDGNPPTFSSALFRIFLFSFIFFSHELVAAIPMPLVFNLILSVIVLGLFLYNGLLVLIPNRFTLHDWSVSTLVVESKMLQEAIQKRGKPKMKNSFWALAAICFLLTGSLYSWIGTQNSDLWETTSEKVTIKSNIEQKIQSRIKQELHLKNKVSTSSSQVFTTIYEGKERVGEKEIKTLEVHVKMNSSSWNEEEHFDTVVQIVWDSLHGTPINHDELKIKVKLKKGFFSQDYARTFKLN